MKLSFVSPAEFREIVHTLSTRSRVLVCLAAFSFFSIMGFVSDVMNIGARPGWRVGLDVVLSGGMAVLYLVAIFRSMRALVLLAVAHVVIALLIEWLAPAVMTAPLTGDALRQRMAIDGAGIIAALSLGYTCAISFTSIESTRFQRIQTEMRLAGEIHQSLVPRLEGSVAGFEYAGVSHPSGTVGGDLIDVVELPGGFAAYLVDVSGHGVRAGVLMGMVKSAARMALRDGAALGEWLTSVSRVLYPLKASSMYATAVAVQARPEGLEFSVAGHLPILRVRAADGGVEELTIPQLPLAMFEDRAVASAPLPCDPGDVLVLLTDGLSEVFDRHDRELGLDALKAVAARHRREPLGLVADAMVAAARSHGEQQDDQTVLLLRRLG